VVKGSDGEGLRSGLLALRAALTPACPRSLPITPRHPDEGQGPVHRAATHGNLALILSELSLKLGPDLRQDDDIIVKLIPTPCRSAHNPPVPVAREA